MKKKGIKTPSAPRRGASRSWEGRTAAGLLRADVEALLRGEIPFIRVPGYLAPEWCAELTRRFLAHPLEERSYGADKTLQLGLAVAPMLHDRKTYFDRAPKFMEELRAIYRGGEDPLLKLRSELGACTGWRTLDVLEEGRPYESDMIGAVPPGSGVVLHVDSPLMQRDLSVSRFPFRLSWNVYLSTAVEGGELVLYRRAFAKADESFHRGFEGFDPAVVAGAAKAEIRPAPGDLVLLNPVLFHAVRAAKGDVPRVAAHSWIGADPARGELAFWS